MPNVSQKMWRTFNKEDGTTVKCLLDADFLTLVVLEDGEGNSLDIPADMVDLDEIEKGLGFSPKLH